METTSVAEFGELARTLSYAARLAGFNVPSFRSPPHVSGKTRTVRRFAGGSCLVSVQTKGRSPNAVMADMIEGVIVANGLTDNLAVAARRTLAKAFVHHAQAA